MSMCASFEEMFPIPFLAFRGVKYLMKSFADKCHENVVVAKCTKCGKDIVYLERFYIQASDYAIVCEECNKVGRFPTDVKLLIFDVTHGMSYADLQAKGVKLEKNFLSQSVDIDESGCEAIRI